MQPPSTESWQHDILHLLDQAAESYKMPPFYNETFPPALMRITLFRDAAEWLIVFEKVAYSINEQLFLNMVYGFGNQMAKQGYQGATEIVTACPGATLFDDEGDFLLKPSDFEVALRGECHRFKPSEEEYRKAHIAPDSSMRAPLRILRLLAALNPDALFHEEESLVELCNRRLLSPFMQLTEWHHPDVYEDELPSHTGCFQSLALALAKGDPSVYECPEPINSHWWLWEEA